MRNRLIVAICLAITLLAPTWSGDVGVTVSPAASAPSAQCPGDFNGDEKVNLADFLAFAGAFGTRSGDGKYNARMDMNGSGGIDLSDFLAFAGVFGTTCEDRPRGSVGQDRAALVALYNATDGPNWKENTNWLTDTPLGDWYGVETDASGRVTGLELDSNALGGLIPPELGSLSNLQRLHLTENSLHGHIPSELGMLENLRSLNLRVNLLTRTIPPALGKLAKLETLRLNYNLLTGTIPPELGGLSELEFMRLDINELSGLIPSQLGSLTNLRYLDLGRNNLSGPIPTELVNLPRLGVLDLYGNELTGSIPSELGERTRLQHLSLNNNKLTGRIPPWLADLVQLRSLGLDGNELTGPIPRELGNLAELKILDLAGNQLTGPIPPELGKLAELERLTLAGNRLSGPVPPELGNLRSLVELTISDNQLSGSLPHTIAGLDSLVTMDCRETRGVCMPATDAFRAWAQQVEARGGIQLAVNIPWCNEVDVQALERLYKATNGDRWIRSDGWLEAESLARWHGVTTDSNGRASRLDLSGNGLSGYLPDAMGLLASLTELRIRGNALSGRMPLSLAVLPLVQFDYAETALCVADDAGFRQWLNGIPRHKGTGAQCPPLTDREALEWVYRRTDGPSWHESTRWLTDAPLAQWHGVETDTDGRVIRLNLANNGLFGTIPAEIGALSALTHLDLGSNRLEGAIPSEIGRLSVLRELVLDNNLLTGSIPPEIGALLKLTHLNLGVNRLFDTIPTDIGRLSELRVLNLDLNNLSGPIPPEVGALDRLERLVLGRNHFSGGIPREIGRLVNLRTVNLSKNNLSGPVPAELGALDRLSELRVDRNQLSGEIPKELSRLASLDWLNLAENQLVGSIPREFGNLNRLERLSLESNQLSGELPAEVGRLTELTWLNLAENQLSGPIPARMGDLENLVEMDLGDNRLAGPLPAELGRAARLENLNLRSNALTGPVPPEFASLTLLKSLILADNPDLAGTVPSGITALGLLRRLVAGGTGLCRPADAAFDAWYGAIPERYLVRCREGPDVYLTQTVQSWHDPVPLLAGESALLRVFVTAPQDATETMPDVQATFYVNGAQRHTVRIAAASQIIPSELMEGDLELSANAEIPGSVISPGLEMVIEVDKAGALDPSLGVTRRIPEEGRMTVDVRDLPPLQLTLIPFLHESEPDLSIAESVLEMAKDPDGHELLADVRTLLPVTELSVAAHEPVTTSFQDPYELLRQTEAMRTMEGGSGYWMGVIQKPPRTGGASFYYVLPSGVAYTGGVASVSVRKASTIAHELGHNLALMHAPCGNPDRVDPWFPYPTGNTGAWGYNVINKALVAPATPDLMSYCTNHGYWISDYFYNKALNHRLASEAAAAAKPAVYADPAPSLLLWGGRDKDGVPYLDPAFVVDAVPSASEAGGAYTIEAATSDGMPVFSYTFDMPVTADAEGEETSFVFALPLQPEWTGNLASITLSGPGGVATLDETTDRPMAILRDLQTGQVRGFLSDLTAEETVQAAEGASAAKPGVEVIFSRGIPELR